MQRVYTLLITTFIFLFFWSCSSLSDQPWTSLIPSESSFLIIPKDGVTLSSISETRYASILDDITSSSSQQVAGFDPEILSKLSLKGVFIFPSKSTESELVWITSTDEPIDSWVKRFYKPLSQNYYTINGNTIHKIEDNNGTLLYVSQINDWLVFSSSSLAVESSIRSYFGLTTSMEIPVGATPGQLIMNTPKLDTWLEQFLNVNLRPSVTKSFAGTRSASLLFANTGDSLNSPINLSGKITLSDTSRSTLVHALSSKNEPIELDRFIASNAAAFALFRLSPNSTPRKPTTRLTDLDKYLLETNSKYSEIANTLDTPFAVETFSESGLVSNGEYLFMRKLRDVRAFRNILEEFVQENLISKFGNSYFASSTVLSELIGSELSPFTDFYISFSRDVVVISNRRGLSESVESDRARRRVIYYNDDYSNTRNDLPSEVSGFVWVESSEFQRFLEPYLLPKNEAAGLFNQFELAHITVQRLNQSSIDFSFETKSKEGSTQPYQELWVTSLSNSDLTGAPILGDVAGSSTDEIIYATDNGNVVAVAGDGTIVLQTSTNGNIPVGSPVLYDWYGNNQPVIMIGAGSKIFAWNRSGALLPKFPIELNQQITAPIVVTDVRRNGIPEVIAATEDRLLHVIDGRGENVPGWPRNVNTAITSKPIFAQVDGTWSIWAFSQNILHSWLRNGAPRPGYPQFVNAGFNGSPLIYESSIYGAGSDGNFYAIGKNPSFSDSLGTFVSMDSISVKSLYVTNNDLLSVGIAENVLLKDSTNFYREDLLLAQSRNGSVFGFNLLGELRLTENLGQPASQTFQPLLVDIDSDKNDNLLALAEFGRLFAWEVLTGERFYDLPTSGMKYPIITDLNGDGQKELIAQTREGLRCWTILNGD
jgi:hypothetical protein